MAYTYIRPLSLEERSERAFTHFYMVPKIVWWLWRNTHSSKRWQLKQIRLILSFSPKLFHLWVWGYEELPWDWRA